MPLNREPGSFSFLSFSLSLFLLFFHEPFFHQPHCLNSLLLLSASLTFFYFLFSSFSLYFSSFPILCCSPFPLSLPLCISFSFPHLSHFLFRPLSQLFTFPISFATHSLTVVSSHPLFSFLLPPLSLLSLCADGVIAFYFR